MSKRREIEKTLRTLRSESVRRTVCEYGADLKNELAFEAVAGYFSVTADIIKSYTQVILQEISEKSKDVKAIRKTDPGAALPEKGDC